MNTKNLNLSHISTGCLVRTLLRNLWMIAASAAVFAMSVSLFFSWSHTPSYQADMTYAVTSRVTSFSSYGNTSATAELTATLTELLPSNMVIGRIRNSSNKLTGFDGTLTARQVGDTNVIVVTCTDDSPEDAFLAIRAVEELFPTVVQYVSADCVVQVIRNPDVSGTPINDVNTTRLTRFAALAGAALMAALLCWLSISRETIQTRTGARDLLDAPIIATVERVRKRYSLKQLLRRKQKPLQVFSPTTGFAYTEQINTVCAQIELDAARNASKIFMVTGVSENEGKSTIAGNVAAALAMRGNRVALVDCDLRNPSLCRFFDSRYVAALPLNRLLSQSYTKDNLLQCMIRHNQFDLFMLFSHNTDRRCTELLTSHTMTMLLQQLRIFDYVILDTPPMGYFADTEALLDKADATLLVVRQDRTPACDINDSIDLLRRSDARFLGCVLNDMTSSLTEGHGYGYGYGYGYGKSGYGHYGHYGYGSSRKHS